MCIIHTAWLWERGKQLSSSAVLCATFCGLCDTNEANLLNNTAPVAVWGQPPCPPLPSCLLIIPVLFTWAPVCPVQHQVLGLSPACWSSHCGRVQCLLGWRATKSRCAAVKPSSDPDCFVFMPRTLFSGRLQTTTCYRGLRVQCSHRCGGFSFYNLLLQFRHFLSSVSRQPGGKKVKDLSVGKGEEGGCLSVCVCVISINIVGSVLSVGGIC